MDYINICFTAVKAYIHSFIRGPSIEVMEGTKNIARIPVWHRGRLMAVYLPVNVSELNHGPIKYIGMDGNPIDILPVNGIKVSLTPDMFNAQTIEITDSLTDESVFYDCNESFSI